MLSFGHSQRMNKQPSTIHEISRIKKKSVCVCGGGPLQVLLAQSFLLFLRDLLVVRNNFQPLCIPVSHRQTVYAQLLSVKAFSQFL